MEKIAAKSISCNRVQGTLETKNIVSVTNAKIYGKMMLENVLPVIKSKWPRGDRDKDDIIIQEDNAKPHHARISAAVEKTSKDDEWNVVVWLQPQAALISMSTILVSSISFKIYNTNSQEKLMK